MKQGDRRYTVTWHQSGQPRPYADTIRDFTLKVEWIAFKKRAEGEAMEWEPNDMTESIVDKAAKAIGNNFYSKEDRPDWASPTLKSKTKTGPGEWRYIITETFTDYCDAFNLIRQMRDECADLREQLAQERRAYAVVMERLRITQGRLVRATQQTVSR